MKFRFLHAADIHLDSPLRKLQRYDGSPYEKVRSAPRQALSRLVDTAIERDVQFVLIAGDLYDGTWRDHNTGLFFTKEAARLRDAGIPLYLIAGNHDSQSTITGGLPMPRNADGSPMLLSSERPETMVLDQLGVAIHGRGFGERAVEQNLAATYPAPIPGHFNLGMLHTSLTGSGQHNPYAPCTPSQLASHGYDYWALGHIHQRGNHHRPGDSPIVFPGNLQGRHIGELGAKGAVLVEVNQGRCELEFVPLDIIRWLIAEVDCGPLTQIDDLDEQFKQQIRLRQQQHPDHLLIVRCVLRGSTTIHRELHARRETMEAQLRTLAIDEAQDQVWLESMQLQTKPTTERTDTWQDDGPSQAIFRVVKELRETAIASTPGTSLEWDSIISDLQELRSKLPARLRDAPHELKLEDQGWLANLLDDVEPMLMDRLSEQDEA